MRKIDMRALMERAVEVMQQSVAEVRADGKVCPKVGAVLLKPDGSIDVACRGELRQGDHAKYTLLERKNRANKLDGSILFATLEPCAPGARKPPRLGCAERIVNARIREVWVGIEDPDPLVDRKGIKYLQENDITVHMFDRDLQERIKAANREFIAQALERAAAVEEETSEIVLSNLESPIASVGVGELSKEALEAFRSFARIPDEVSSIPFNHRLARLGLLHETDKGFQSTGFGVLLFDREPRLSLQQAGLLATIYYPDGREEVEDFDGSLVFVPEQALAWLRDKLSNPISRSEAHRVETNAPVFELAREGIVNALVHRDYSIAGAKCQMIVNIDTITVMSPGMPIEPITLEQLKSFTAPMLSRNPVLHYVFGRMEMAEERGLGLGSMRQRATEAGLPLPRYTWVNPYLVLTIFISRKAVVSSLSPEVLRNLSNAEQSGWQWISTQPRITSAAYMEALGIPYRTAANHLKHFTDLGILRRKGTGPATYYEVETGQD